MTSKRDRIPRYPRRILRTSLAAVAGLILLGLGMTACRNGGDAAPSATSAIDDYVGKWNIRITDAEDTFAAGQIDVEKKGDELAAGLVWRWGSYGPATEAYVEDGALHVVRTAEKDGEDVGEDVFEARLVDGTLKGQVRYPDGATHHFEGRPAPALAVTGEPQWGEPVTLFDGKTLDGWRLRDPEAKMGWAVVDSELAVVDPKGNADLVSEKTFQDLKLHIEFNVDPHSNSGVYLRGRYEIQIESGDPDSKEMTQKCGALYSRIAPSTDATKPGGEWQVYDITLVGRELEVVLNGTTVVDGIVEGITGGAINPFEDEPGPLMLQGDHGKVRFRNVVVTPAK